MPRSELSAIIPFYHVLNDQYVLVGTTKDPEYVEGVTMSANLQLFKVSETSSTITLGWNPVQCIGFRFSSSLTTKSSVTWDASRTTVRFSKGAAWYKVEALSIAAEGVYVP